MNFSNWILNRKCKHLDVSMLESDFLTSRYQIETDGKVIALVEQVFTYTCVVHALCDSHLINDLVEEFPGELTVRRITKRALEAKVANYATIS